MRLSKWFARQLFPGSARLLLGSLRKSVVARVLGDGFECRFFLLSNKLRGGYCARMESLSHFLLIAAFASIFQERKSLTLIAFLVALGVTALTLRLHITESLPLNF
jgi:hypothetical protein